MTDQMNEDIYRGISRNATCPCGSGKRFKHCHGNSSNQQGQSQSLKTQTKSSHIFNENDLFCAVQGKFYNLSKNKQMLFVSKHTEARIQLDEVAFYLMQELEVFATYKEHLVNCSRKLQINEDVFRNHINVLYQQGLLIRDSAVINDLKKPFKKSNPNFSGICIRTCESPTFLKRILDSQIRRKNKFGASEVIYVFDDTSTKKVQLENERIIKQASTEIDINYLGLGWQIEFVNSLIEKFPENKKTIEKMLLPQPDISFSGGRLINLALLFFAGKCFLNFDDDFILDDARIHSEYLDKGININSRIDWVYEGFDSYEKVQQSGVPLRSDPIEFHKKTLGINLSEFLSEQEDYILTNNGLTETPNYILERFKPNSYFVTTGNGWFGTPGKRNARFLFSNTYKETNAPWKNENSYNELLNGGYCWDTTARLQIMANSVSNPAGINNMKILAPTLSTCQGEDTLLCSMSHTLYPNSLHLGFPWALSHFRHQKDWKNATFNESQPIQLASLISDLAREVNFNDNADTLEKIEIISQILLKTSELPFDQFKTKLLSIWFKKSTFIINKFENQLDSMEQDEANCIEDLQKLINNDVNHLFSDDLPYIEDAIGFSEKEKIVWIQKELKTYANGMKIWPELWTYCAETSEL